jgi:hypothetical protein
MTKSKPISSRAQAEMTHDLGLGKRIEGNFDGGALCSDGGLLLLRKADDRAELSELASLCITDERRPDLMRHSVADLFRQRIYAIAAGYEDCNDATVLRHDAMHRLAVGKSVPGALLASQSSLSRFEAMADQTSNAALQKLLAHQFVRRHKKRPKVVRLQMDTTCDEVYGYQQMTFYNGYYGAYCYAPLLIFTDTGFPLCALLRPGNPSPIDDALRMLKQLLHELRLAWPDVKVELTADAAFADPEIFEFCEENGITYFIAAAGHSGLAYHAEALIKKCKEEFEEFGYPSPELKKYGLLANPAEAKQVWRQREERIRYSSKAEGRMQEHFEDELHIRKYAEFRYQSREWTKERRFVYRCDYTRQGPDTRFVITNAKSGKPRQIYDDKYCRRSQCENWIKDLKTYLKSDRTSCQEFEANQFRLFLHVFAYILIWDVRKLGQLREMTVATFQLQFLKIAVLVTETARKVQLHFASNHPRKNEFVRAWNAT